MSNRSRKLAGLYFPFGGLKRKYAYEHQEPYTTPDCLNVLPFDAMLSRNRGGSRPGIDKAYPTQLGSGNPIRLLDKVTWVNDDSYNIWTDTFNYTAFGGLWEAPAGYDLPSVTDNLANVEYDTSGRAILSAVTGFDSTQAYMIEVFIATYNGEHHGVYEIFGMLDASDPEPETNGFVATLTISGSSGGGTLALSKYAAGVETEVDDGTSSATAAQSGWFSVLVNGTTVTCYWLGEAIATGTVSGLAGTRQGFGISCTVEGGIALIDQYRTRYYKTTDTQARNNLLVASSNGLLYKENETGGLTQVTSDLTLASDSMLHAQDYLQKLYIADNAAPRVTGTDGETTSGVLADAAGTADWSTYSISADDDVVVLSNSTGSCTDGIYEITSVAAAGVTLTTDPGDGTCSYRIERGAKIYDPTTNAMTLWIADSGKGDVPAGCPVICAYRDRMCLAGAADNPHLWYMSRQGDPQDWDTGQLDSARAVAGSSSDAGQIGQPINAMIAHSDDYLVFGCQNSLWILRGDPAYGGMIDNLSNQIGIVDKGAWCKGPNGEIIFLSRDGIYELPPGAQQYPRSVSRELLPQELIDVSSNIYTVNMAYDARLRVVHIYLSSENAQTVLHWIFDYESKTFWPINLEGDYDPTAICEYYSDINEESSVLLGGRDGYIRKYSPYFETDGGNQIDSYVMLGPIRMGGNDYEDGMISEIYGKLAEDSGDVDWGIYTADTAEGAVMASTAAASGTWVAGLNYKEHPRVRGGSMIVKLSGAESVKWAYESGSVIREYAGRSRKD